MRLGLLIIAVPLYEPEKWLSSQLFPFGTVTGCQGPIVHRQQQMACGMRTGPGSAFRFRPSINYPQHHWRPSLWYHGQNMKRGCDVGYYSQTRDAEVSQTS